jgi:Rad3-related DNA helicase
MSYPVAVRTLCDFTAKRGDLDLRFTPAPTAQEGMTGHSVVASRRGPSYQAEVSLTGEYGELRVRGRADGYDSRERRVDECKTFRGDLTRMPANHRALHWAQLKTYGWLLCQRDDLADIELALVYFDIKTQKETILQDRFDAIDLKASFENACATFTAWADQELPRIVSRNAALAQLAFPHPSFYEGQRQLAESVYRTASTGGCLLAQAPTGIGKTVGTLFPMLKALGKGKLEKIFFLTAKSTGRKLALDAIAVLNRGMPQGGLRTIELVARDKVCEYRDRECHGDSCPLAKGFYDRLAGARAAALTCEVMDQVSIRRVALHHQVCPYYLSQEMVRWSDVVIGDYNYYLDYGGLLHGLTLEHEWRVGILADEAHNLIERGRKMYSCSLNLREGSLARQVAPKSVQPTLDKLLLNMTAIAMAQPSSYIVYDDIPTKMLAILKELSVAIADLTADVSESMADDLLHFYFAAIHFCRLAEEFGDHALCDGTLVGEDLTICIRNVVPAAHLRSKWKSASCCVLFSATLTPRDFYVQLLGLPERTSWLDVSSPFDARQLSIHVASNVSTRYTHRKASVSPIVDLIAQQFERHPGNYLVFASSFDYLRQICRLFAMKHPRVSIWSQEPLMSEAARQSFLARFTEESCGIGFAVLGGAFAEGIDLPGSRLIGAFIVTLGIPQINAVNEQMMLRMQTLFGAGYEYVYLYPGIRKVAQAAGRVVRSKSDQGSLFLIDDRYAESQVQALLPAWWRIGAVSEVLE